MRFIEYPRKSAWKKLATRPIQDLKQIEKVVLPVLKKVKKEGDKALRFYAETFDKITLTNLAFSEEELKNAEKQLSNELKAAIQVAYNNICSFHKAQLSEPQRIETMQGVSCWRKSVGIEKVGLYIPGGTAPLFSTVLMLGIPAQLAQCKEVVLCTPSNHPAILYAATLVGISKVFRVGGSQAIAAMAYGTESIPQVYKIFGPGNQYVTAAKQLVSREGIAIDMPAGPSEVAVLADDTAIPAFVASDLLSQAEHGIDSQVIFISTSRPMAEAVQKELETQLKALPRKEIAEKALENSTTILMKDTKTAMEFMNQYAPEHLILAVKEAEKVAEMVVNAGSVFIGNYTPESCGDYASGTNHTLPTNGFAKAYSGVSVDSFVKKITFQHISQEGIKNIGKSVEIMAEAEELQAHANAVKKRLEHLF